MERQFANMDREFSKMDHQFADFEREIRSGAPSSGQQGTTTKQTQLTGATWLDVCALYSLCATVCVIFPLITGGGGIPCVYIFLKVAVAMLLST